MIQAQGFRLRKAVEAPARPLLLIGVWAHVPAGVWWAALYGDLIVNFRGLGNFVFFWVSIGVMFISGVILYRVTRNISRRRDETSIGQPTSSPHVVR